MFANATPYAARSAQVIDAVGAEQVVVVCKATFVRKGVALVLKDEQLPVRLADVPWDQEAPSSLKYFGELSLHKAGAEMVIVGEAIARRPVEHMDVAVRTPERSLVLRVHGERVFYRSALGLRIGPAAPFERASLQYERAYGGTSKDGTVVDGRNPVGRGAHATLRELEDAPAPCIEDPQAPIRGTQRSVPVGLGALPSWWSPRKEHAGTLDNAWLKARMPLPAVDQSPRFHRVAPPALQIERPFTTGDVLAVSGMCEEGTFDVTIPALGVVAHVRRASGAKATLPLVLDTALLEPAKRQVELTLRAVVPLGRGQRLLREVRLDASA